MPGSRFPHRHSIRYHAMIAGSLALLVTLGCQQSPPSENAKPAPPSVPATPATPSTPVAAIQTAPDADPVTATDQQPAGEPPMTLIVQSPAFQPGATIPKAHTGEGDDWSPQLSWTNIPAATVEFALIVDDPDAPTSEPWVHWVLYKIPGGGVGLGPGLGKAEKLTDPEGPLEGRNSWGKNAYGGPMPPPGHGVHHYHFKLYALNTALDLPAGLTKAELLRAMEGHILATGELIGKYQR